MSGGAPGADARSARVLIVEDRESLRRMMERALAGEGYEVESAGDVAAGAAILARAAVSGRKLDVVLTDLKLPDGSGLDVVAAARRLEPPPAVVVMTGYGSVAAAVEAMKLGAADFLEKPLDLDQLFRLVGALSGRAGGSGARAPESAVFEVPGAPPIVGAHPRLRAALKLLERVAPTESTVLLTGESGTGKELFARALHALSPRRSGPFVAVNCAAIPETLVESELFGHEKGAFTGADRRRPGRFEQARAGTLLLDEIGDLPLAMQAKVLRVLDDRHYERVGGATSLESDTRVVAATNRDLARMVESGDFRADLLYRLEIFPIALPSLSERASDLPLLARHLLASIAAKLKLAPPELLPEAERWLESQSWPGNVRQLANLLERLVIVAGGAGGRVGAADLERLQSGVAARGRETATAGAASAPDEISALREALVAAGGDKQAAARALGVSYRTLLRRIERHDLHGFPKYRT